MSTIRFLAGALPVLVLLPALSGFNGHVVTEGPLTLTIDAIPVVTACEVVQPCRVTLANSAAEPLVVGLEMSGLVDDCRASGAVRRSVQVPGKGSIAETFNFICGPKTHSAHYPVHVRATFDSDGARRTAHAVQIFETSFSRSGADSTESAVLPVLPVPASGAFALAELKQHQVTWAYAGQPAVRLPIGWTGSDPASATNFQRGPVTRGEQSRPALQIHPPYRPRAGTALVEYRLQLPATQPLRVEFFNAIRDSTPREGSSDGVTFRVWAGERKLFERHTDSKVWLPGGADLSAFAGQTISLRFESHPGPRNNTTCDSSFWGDPVIVAGAPPKMVNDDQRVALLAQARERLRSAPDIGKPTLEYTLAGGLRAVIVPGPNGIADGAIAFGDGQRRLAFAGLHMAVREQLLGTWPSGAVVQGVEMRPGGDGRTELVHRLKLNGRDANLIATVWSEGPALRIKVACGEPITALGLNPADQAASRVYYGHGYCIVDPQPFRASAGGHNLATSHVGFDFEGGVSLLTASDTPVDHLQVDPARRIYRLQTHPDATLTFVPGTSGAFDCAVRYRPLYDKTAAPGVAAKAGRFVFDLWGGRYADNTAQLSRCFEYGLTNALVMMHNWQRWGYDYRLPDIFPPNPALGSLEDLQELGRCCRERGVLWGLHDNYIDLYPDATGFSYEHVTFTSDGRPRRAWLNEGRNAQSYQFRPDRIRPFVESNLRLIVPALRPTASFVDVFASINSFDFHDAAGIFHSKRETQRAWGEAFAAIREACGDYAPTVSEAGSDHLIGWLDGSDAQLIQLGPRPERFHNVVRCREWEWVPWFDAVNHVRFSLHGAGYSDRYQGGRSREEHGIESDDYLSAEVLTGHALMVDRTAMVRGAVRKYWLAQEFIESIARDEIRRVEWAGDDIHHAIVTWNSGARVHVNRGETDWAVDGHVLPQFGFHARNGAIACSVERIGGAVVERSRGRSEFYVNSRVFAPGAPVAITPSAERVEYLGDRKFRLVVNWDARQPATKDCAVFYHFSRPTPGRRALTEFFGGGAPEVSTTRWHGRVTTGENWTITIPDAMPPGEYEVLVGLHDRRSPGERLRLQGDEDPRRRYRIGKLTIAGDKSGAVTGVRLERPERPHVPSARWTANTAEVDFGPVKTTGAFRCQVAADHAVVTPLPDGDSFELQLRLAELFGRPAEVVALRAIDRDGQVGAIVPFTREAGALVFKAEKSVFAYRLEVR